jgi:hypothetical protein
MLVLIVTLALTGCASGGNGPRLSSLGREAALTPLRGQAEAQMVTDDQECERWTRATKGKDEPMPSADLRYILCATSKGYAGTLNSVMLGDVTIGHVQARPLAVVLGEWRQCRADKIELDPMTAAPVVDVLARRKALTCLEGLGYTVQVQEYADPSPVRQ